MSNFSSNMANLESAPRTDADILNLPRLPVNSPVMGMMADARTDTATAAMVKETIDRHLIRWGFNPILRFKPVDSTRCRFSSVPYAEWFIIHSFNTVHAINNMDEYDNRREEIVTISARDAELYLANSLAGKQIGTLIALQGLPDWGFVVGFHGEEDIAKMRALSSIVLPPLSDIRNICGERKWKNPIGEFCAGADDMDASTRESCPTCWAAWLKSDELKRYIGECVTRGITISVNGQPATIMPELADLENARSLMLNGFTRGISTLTNEWSKIVGEYNRRPERGGRKNISDNEHLIRKDLHKDKPEDRDIALVKNMSRAQSEEGTSLTNAVALIAQNLSALQSIIAKDTKDEPQPTAVINSAGLAHEINNADDSSQFTKWDSSVGMNTVLGLSPPNQGTVKRSKGRGRPKKKK